MSLADIETRNSRIIELARDNPPAQQILDALKGDYPDLTKSAVANIVLRARDRGELPPTDIAIVRARQSEGGKRGIVKRWPGLARRDAAIVALVREGGRSYPQIAEALREDWPAINHRIVRVAVADARERGELPPADPVELLNRAVQGGSALPGPRGLDEKSLAIIAMAQDGSLSNNEIAKTIAVRWAGTTRNMVAGIVHRARQRGLLPPGPGTPNGGWRRSGAVRKPKSAKPSPVRRERVAAKRPGEGSKALPPREIKPFVLPPLPDVPIDAEARERRQLAFQAMTDSHGCKFPIGDLHAEDFRFCCAEKDADRSYCNHHHTLTHTTPNDWRRSNRHAFAEAAE